ncbi:MAG: flagellar filament capping protein FliD [Acetivibrio ethanolgignens]
MPIRMTGMASGLDTEALIKELMSAKSAKKTKIEQKKTKLEWKQEKWAELNTKIYKLYTDQLSKLRLAGNYGAKKATSSNESIVTATATTSAGSGSHTIEVLQLASAQYVTGKQVSGLKADSKLTEAGMTEGTVIKITSGSGSGATVKTLEVTDGTTINDFVGKMKEAGLNASFDEGQRRFFISSKQSGADNAFSIETYQMGSGESLALKTAEEQLKAAGLSDSQISEYRSLLEDLEKKQNAYDNATSNKVDAWTQLQEAKKKVSDMEGSFYDTVGNKKVAEKRLAALKEARDGISNDDKVKKAYQELETSVKKDFYKLDADGNIESPETFSEARLDEARAAYKNEAVANINKQMEEGSISFDTLEQRTEAIEKEYQKLLNAAGGETEALKKKAQEQYEKARDAAISNAAQAYTSTEEGKAAVSAEAAALKSSGSLATQLSEYSKAVKDYSGAVGNATGGTPTTGQLSGLGLTDIVNGAAADTSVNLTKAADAKVKLDGAELTGTSNSFTVAGVTYDLKKAEAGTSVSVNVTNNTQETFDMVKSFVKGYNELLKEMNTLYYADSAKGYEPLTKDEKEAMSDKQVELWEDKIKKALLRRDDTLNSLMTTMRTSLQTSVTVKGTKYSLASFGITTGQYTEKGLLHLYGDSEDSAYADKENKLMKMLSEKPEETAEALSGIARNLYSALQDKMKASSVSSALTFYNDKQMKKQVTGYTQEIKTWESRLKDMEDRYYKQFATLESTMAKLQSQGNYFSSMLGR